MALACPSRSDTTFTGWPGAMSSVAWVWRRSCDRILGSWSPTQHQHFGAAPIGHPKHGEAAERLPELLRLPIRATVSDTEVPCPTERAVPGRRFPTTMAGSPTREMYARRLRC